MAASDASNPILFLGTDRLPTGGFLIVPTRLDLDDLRRLESRFQGKSPAWLTLHGAPYPAEVTAHLEASGNAKAFSPEATSTDDFKKSIAEMLADDGIAIFVPPPAAAHVGSLTHVPTPVLRYLIDAGLPIVPLYVEKPREVALAIEVADEQRETVFAFADVLANDQLSLANYIERLLLGSEQALSERLLFNSHLGYALLKGLKIHGASSSVIDGTDDSELPFDKLLAAAIALSRRLRRESDNPRIGIVLPPGKAGLLANIAVILAAKTPVNMNFTAGADAVESCFAQAKLDFFITASPFIEKFPRFPWPPDEQLLRVEQVLPRLKPKIAAWLMISKVLSAPMLASLLGVPKRGGDAEAVLLFTSGSSGAPKGVALSHRNVLSNVTQFGGRLHLGAEDKVLGCLPLFHSFGATVTMWYPVIEGLDLITYPSPLEAPTLAGLIEKYRVTLFISTPTFLRGYLRRVKAEQLASLKLVVVGAEKLPQKLAATFNKKFDKVVLEGYGLTETSPVTNANIHDPGTSDGRHVIRSYREGSVGQMLPGIAVKIAHPDNNQPQPLNETGMIWLRGPNVFRGYLDLPKKTAEVIVDDWFCTGDIGRIDDDGFLYIEGRLSRFSKIGGEMVPHETVEAHITKALGIDGEDQRKIAIIGVPDESKGEALVLVNSLRLDDDAMNALRKKLLDAGLVALWIPKRRANVDAIPVLASGKLDIKGCEEAARAASS